MKEEEIETLKKKAQFYFANHKFVHISLKNTKWHNAQIIDVETDFFMILDQELGELPVFYKEIVQIVPYTTKIFTKKGEENEN